MNDTKQQRDLQIKILSQKLDRQIEHVNSQDVHHKVQTVNSMTPFDLLEQKLRRLQEKLEKVQESDSRHIYKQRKNSSSNNSRISTNRNHKDKKVQLNHQSFTKNTNLQIRSAQKPFGRKKSFDCKDGVLESQMKANSQRKIFKTQKKYISSTYQANGKNSRMVSAKKNSNKSSKLNSKINTPKKKKNTIVSTKDHKDHNFESIQENNKTSQGQIGMKRKLSKNTIKSTGKKGKDCFQSQFQSGYKLLPKNINNTGSESNLKKKSLTSMSQSNVFLTSKKIQRNIGQQSIRTEQKRNGDQKYVTNCSQKLRKKEKKETEVNKGLMSLSRQPMVLVKEKKKVEKQLKEKSRQNVKLKQEISKLQKYQDEYNKMREIFEKFEKEKRNHKSRR